MFKAIYDVSIVDLPYFDRVKCLSVLDLSVMFEMYSLCYKGKRIRCFRRIENNGVAKVLNLSYSVVRGSIKRLVALKLLDKTTTSFQTQSSSGNKKYWQKSSYYRINKDYGNLRLSTYKI